MNCKVCGKDIFKHSTSDANNCLQEAGFKTKGVQPMNMVSLVKVPLTINFRHKNIIHEKKSYTSKNIDLDILRFCLIGDNITENKKAVEKEPPEEEVVAEEKEESRWNFLNKQEEQ